MRIAALAFIALVSGAASAQTPAQTMGDFDGDGRLDSATLTVSGGKYKLEAEFGGEARKHVVVAEGAAAQAPTKVDVRKAGNAEVLALALPGGATAVYSYKSGAFVKD